MTIAATETIDSLRPKVLSEEPRQGMKAEKRLKQTFSLELLPLDKLVKEAFAPNRLNCANPRRLVLTQTFSRGRFQSRGGTESRLQ